MTGTGQHAGSYRTSDLGLAAWLRMLKPGREAVQEALSALDDLEDLLPPGERRESVERLRSYLTKRLGETRRLELAGASRQGRKFAFVFLDPEGIAHELAVVYSETCCTSHDDSVRRLRAMT